MKTDKGLGRGLGALLQNTSIGNQESVREIPLDDIVNHQDQPRKYFDEDALKELAASIQQHGLLQPILVRPHNGKYEIIAGERRWRAAKLLEMKTIPSIVKVADDKTLPELALIENLQREDLGVIEEAMAYQALWETYGYTQEELAQKLGKGRVYISNTMRLLQLSKPVLALLQDKYLTPGHARVLLRITDPEQQMQLAEHIVQQGLSVRQTEKLINRLLAAPEKEQVSKPENQIYLKSLEEKIQNHFSSKIKITDHGKKGGKIELFYYNNEDLDRLLELMGIEED